MSETGDEVDGDVWRPVAERASAVSAWTGFLDDGEDEWPRADLPGPLERLRRSAAVALRTELDFATPFLLSPLVFGLGAVVYFLAPREPDGLALAILCAVTLGAAAWTRERARAIWTVCFLLAAGLAAGKLRTTVLDTPALGWPSVGILQGTVEWTETRANGSVRYTVRVRDFDGRGAPDLRRVRVSNARGGPVLAPGDGLRARVRLMPPAGPVVPGGYDFGFFGWFQGRGAAGFTLGAVERAGPTFDGVGIEIARWRFGIGQRIDSAMDRETGPLAKALVIGDRSGIAEPVAESLRISGLAHILAISGLHMMLVTGLVFVSLRKVCALVSVESLRWQVKKWAAGGALLFATAYLLLSGMNVSTQRAYVMVCIMLAAVLIDRRALTLRNVALAAFVVLAWQPEAVFAPGFQMSFAAATALVSAYALWLRWRPAQGERGWFATAGANLAGLSFTSLVAGFATSPFAAYHFHRIATLSLPANLLAMPIVSLAVMPLVVLAVLVMPLGLDPLVLPLLGWALEAVVAVSLAVSDWEGLVRTGIVPAATFALLVTAFCWLTLLRTWLRLLGLVPLALAALPVTFAATPILAVHENGENVAAIQAERLVLSRGRETSFANKLIAESFPRDGAVAKFACDPLGCAYASGEGTAVAVSRDERSLVDDCRRAGIVVTSYQASCPSDALVIDGATLRRRGAALVERTADGAFAIRHAYGTQPRPWTRHRFPADDRR